MVGPIRRRPTRGRGTGEEDEGTPDRGLRGGGRHRVRRRRALRVRQRQPSRRRQQGRRVRPQQGGVRHRHRHYDDERFTLIENGDNDDLWEFNPRHILEANKATFDLLRTFHLDGRYLRLFGNHDIQMRKPGYVSQHFDRRVSPVTPGSPCCRACRCTPRSCCGTATPGRRRFVVHKSPGRPAERQNWWMTMWSYRLFWKRLHALGFRSPSSPIANSSKRHFSVELREVDPQPPRRAHLRAHAPRALPARQRPAVLQLGGVHLPRLDDGARDQGAISLVTWRVEADVNGYLHVVRRVLLGPEPLAAFDIRHVPDSQLADRLDRTPHR